MVHIASRGRETAKSRRRQANQKVAAKGSAGSSREFAKDRHALARGVKSAMKSSRLSIDALAARTGIARAIIEAIERAQPSKAVTFGVLQRLARGLGVPIAALVGGASRPDRKARRRWSQSE